MLMEYSDNQNRYLQHRERDGHIVGVTRDEIRPSSASSTNSHSSSNDSHFLDIPYRATQAPAGLSVSNTRGVNFLREDNHDRQRQRSPLNSGLWVSIEFLIILGQIVAAIVVLSVSRKEKPRTPLFAWVVGYTMGCFATLPHLYWRYRHRSSLITAQESTHIHQNSSNNAHVSSSGEGSYENTTISNDQNTGSPHIRLDALVDQFKMALDFFFAIWFVVGNVWVFGQHSSSSDAPNLYRLCIVFLVFSCIGYAMPLILCVTICCCFPCIASFLSSQEDLLQCKGAHSELIDALPIYKFKSKRVTGKASETNLEDHNEGGMVAAGTSKERILSAEDAVCCICLAMYVDKDELRELSCTHLFHKKCVDEWLRINALCPLCKSGIRGAQLPVSRVNFGFHGL